MEPMGQGFSYVFSLNHHYSVRYCQYYRLSSSFFRYSVETFPHSLRVECSVHSLLHYPQWYYIKVIIGGGAVVLLFWLHFELIIRVVFRTDGGVLSLS